MKIHEDFDLHNIQNQYVHPQITFQSLTLLFKQIFDNRLITTLLTWQAVNTEHDGTRQLTYYKRPVDAQVERYEDDVI